MIAALLWKDFRLAVPALLTAGVLFAASFLSIFLLSRSMTPGPFPWLEAVLVSAHFCQWSMVAVAALLGGALFAAEREDGSLQLVRALPLHRRDIILSKIIIALLIFESLGIGLALIVHAAAPFTAFGSRDDLPGAAGMAAIASISFAVLGTSWAWSAVLAKPVLAALNGGITAAVSVAGLTLAAAKVAGTPVSIDAATPWAIATGLAGVTLGIQTYRTRLAEEAGEARRYRRERRAAPQLAVAAGPGRSSVFRSLLRKDFRLTGSLLAGGVLALAIPFLYAAFRSSQPEPLLERLARASTQSLWMSCLVFALWGGYAIAAERTSKTERFLHALPVSARTAASSRLTLTLAPAIVAYTAIVVAMLMLHARIFRLSPMDPQVTNLFQMNWEALIWQPNSLLFGIPALGMPLVCFAVAWFSSISLARPFLGIGLGATTPGFVLVLWLSFISSTGEVFIPMHAGLLFLILGVVVAVAILMRGYRRIEQLDYA